MWATAEKFDAICSSFPNNELSFDIILDGQNPMATIAFCAHELSMMAIEPNQFSYYQGGQIRLKVLRSNERDTQKLKKLFQKPNAPKVVRWTTIVGRMHSSFCSKENG